MANQTPSPELAGETARATIKQTLIEHGVTEVSGALLDALSALTASGNDVPVAWRWRVMDEEGEWSDWFLRLDEPTFVGIEKEPLYALSTTPTMSAEDMREAAAKRVEQSTPELADTEHLASAIRSIPLTKEPSQASHEGTEG